MSHIVSFALLLAAAAVPTAAQQSNEEAVIKKAREAQRAGRYLEDEALLRPLAVMPDGTIKSGFAGQLWVQAKGRLSGDRPLKSTAPPLDDEDRADMARIASATARDAIAEIVVRARNTRIVILNEDHSEPRTRAFGLAVARALRPLGYDVLAVETLGNYDDRQQYADKMATLAREGHVRRKTGYYTADPVFADFLRQALALGYRPIAYESNRESPPNASVNDQIAEREQAQTDNLIANALGPYPGAKILIYVGFSHVAEEPLERDGKLLAWMAARLKCATGIDPLTIDQTTLLRRSTTETGPTGAAIARAGQRSAVLLHDDAPLVLGQYAGKVNLQVVHPDLPRSGGRPGWLAAMGRVATPIPPSLLPTHGARLIQAFIGSEGEDTVPVDQVLVTAGEPAPSLMLPRTAIRYATQDPPSK